MKLVLDLIVERGSYSSHVPQDSRFRGNDVYLCMPSPLTPKQIKDFQKKVYDYYHANKRDFPWRKGITPYKIVVSEIMLQQTQAPRVVEKFKLFIKTFPNFESLAKASFKDILTVWQGLGYNRRALGLKKLAEIVVIEHRGKLPKTPDELVGLPWIGPHTAGSIAAYAYNYPSIFIETNIRSVCIHEFFGDKIEVTDKELLPYIEVVLDKEKPREWYNALMDYGTWLKETNKNPSRRSKHYTKQSTFKGSIRKLRGMILRDISKGYATLETLSDLYLEEYDESQVNVALLKLTKEGLIIKQKNTFSIS